MGKVPDGTGIPPGGPFADREPSTSELGLYLHVPFCSVRCGYCDFNTYTAEELKREGVTTSREQYLDQVLLELQQAKAAIGAAVVPTIFIGGGTPTVLPVAALGRFMTAVKATFALSAEVEVTVEANPDTLSVENLAALREIGVTRISIGMQSAVPHVLRTLDRTHDPGNVARAVHAAANVGFTHISVDLIYGAPGESLTDWQVTLDAVSALAVDHVSAYALIVEEGTALARRVARGEVVVPEDDETAEKYLMADAAFTKSGMKWYEVSNWARSGGECRHNLRYWQGAAWWGLGPGAHSHVSGVRWWNVKHPAAYAARLEQAQSPAQAREVLLADQQQMEDLMLRIRLAEGLNGGSLTTAQLQVARDHVDRGLLATRQDGFVLTLNGRLMADAIVRDLLV